MEHKENKKVLTRQELFDLVWATPMIDLAKQFNFSDNGLRKICRKFSIPVPKMGHWQKVRYGKPTKKIPLPPFQGNDTIAINILPRVKNNIEPGITVLETITVPEKIDKFHPLIQQARKVFSQKGHEKNGRSRTYRGENALDIAVSASQLSRAYRIMDTIIKSLEFYGAKVGIERENEYKTNSYVQFKDEKVRVEIAELMSINKKKSDRFSFTENEYIPKGKFVFRIKEYLGGCQSKWTEGKNSGLEDKLTPILNGIFFAAAYLKRRRIEREEEHRIYEEEQRRLIQEQQVL